LTRKLGLQTDADFSGAIVLVVICLNTNDLHMKEHQEDMLKRKSLLFRVLLVHYRVVICYLIDLRVVAQNAMALMSLVPVGPP
jgi:hypothetical protein